MRSLAELTTGTGTRNSLTFENQLLLRMGQKSGRSLKILVYAITVVFANVRELRVTPSLGKVPLSYQSEMLEYAYIFPPLYSPVKAETAWVLSIRWAQCRVSLTVSSGCKATVCKLW